MGQKYKKIATLIILTQVSLYNYGSLNKEQESLKQQSNKHIFPGKTIIVLNNNRTNIFFLGKQLLQHSKYQKQKHKMSSYLGKTLRCPM